MNDGTITHKATERTVSYTELVKPAEIAETFQRSIPAEIALTPVSEWKVMGTSVARPNIRDLVTGVHRYPSDIARPGMLYGKILRPPSCGATLESIDLSAAEASKDTVVVRDGQFVGFAAPSTFCAEQALDVVSRTAESSTPALTNIECRGLRTLPNSMCTW